MTCDFMWCAMLQFETKLQNCIRMGKTMFKIFIWGGISSDIRSEITFYGALARRRKTKFPTVYPTIYPPPPPKKKKKKNPLSMTKKYNNHILHDQPMLADPWHHEEKTQNTDSHITNKAKQPALSLPQLNQKGHQEPPHKTDQAQNPKHYGSNNKQRKNNNRITTR